MKKATILALCLALSCVVLCSCGMDRRGNDETVLETPLVTPILDPSVSPIISPDVDDGIVEDQDGIIGNSNAENDADEQGRMHAQNGSDSSKATGATK